MNIHTQVAAALLLSVLVYFYITSKRPKDRSMLFFKKMLVVSSLNVFFDIYSVYVLAKMGQFGLYQMAICKLYLCSMAYLAYISFRYLMEDVAIRSLVYIKNVAVSILLLSWVVIAISPIYYVRDDRSVATYGPAVNAIYLTATLFMISDFVLIFSFKKKMNPNRWKAVFLWLVVWIVSTGIQFVNNRLLLVSFAGTLGLTIVYTKLENTDYYVEAKTGLLNEIAFRSNIDIRLSEKKPFFILGISIDLGDGRNVLDEVNYQGKIIEQVARCIEAVNRASDCYAASGRLFYMIFDTPDNMKEISDKLESRFKEISDNNREYEALRIIRYEILSVGNCPSYDVMNERIRYFITNEPVLDGNCLVMDDSWVEQYMKKIETIHMIDKAILEDRVVPFFQPIYSIEKDRFVSAEALARIIDENGRIIPPGMFIPVAEETRQVEKIGQIIFEKVCRLIKEHNIKQLGIDYIEVNLSAIQCAREDLADVYISIMEEVGVDPAMINLEITESSAVHAKDRLINNMNKLIAKGCSFSLDDFGTGYSNLEYVQELPVEILKFDRTMVLSYFQSGKGKVIMDAVIYMCKILGLKIVAEGVEEKEQLDVLVDAEVDYIQGYYFSKPVTAEDFLTMLE